MDKPLEMPCKVTFCAAVYVLGSKWQLLQLEAIVQTSVSNYDVII